MASKLLLLVVMVTLVAIAAGDDDKKKDWKDKKIMCKDKELKIEDEKVKKEVTACFSKMWDNKKKKEKRDADEDDKKKKKKKDFSGMFGAEFYKCMYKAKGVDDGGTYKYDVIEKFVDSQFPDDVKADYKKAVKTCGDALKDGKFTDDSSYTTYGKCEMQAFMKYCMKKKKKDDD